MTRSQKYISILLERLPKWELRSYEHQTSLDRIRDRVSSSSDINVELESLYKVKDFSEFALSLMWIADKVDKDPMMEESTLAEETLVFSKFRQALGDISVEEQEPTPSVPTFDATPSSGFEAMPPSMNAPTPDVLLTSWGKEPQTQSQEQSTDGGLHLGREQERNFSQLLEQFLESVQSGNEDRTSLLSSIVNECGTVLSAGSAEEDYKLFCRLLKEFLQYISDNQYLDDVRVMNIVSNIQDPVAQWAKSEPGNRADLLDQAVDILRDFKTMFE